jgi:hypothetical protein
VFRQGIGELTVTATVTSQIQEVTLANNSTSASHRFQASAPTDFDLSLSNSWRATPDLLPRLIGYIEVRNAGPGAALDVRIEGQLPDDANIIATGPGSEFCTAPRSAGATFSCRFPFIAAGGSVRFNFTAAFLERQTPEPGTLTIVSWNGGFDVNTLNNTGEVFSRFR